jgi:hypothetical protein
VSEPDTLRLGGDAERLAVAVEAEGAAGLHQFEPRLSIAKEQHLGRAVGAAIDHVQGIGPNPLDAYDLHHRGASDPTNFRTRTYVFKPQHVPPSRLCRLLFLFILVGRIA